MLKALKSLPHNKHATYYFKSIKMYCVQQDFISSFGLMEGLESWPQAISPHFVHKTRNSCKSYLSLLPKQPARELLGSSHSNGLPRVTTVSLSAYWAGSGSPRAVEREASSAGWDGAGARIRKSVGQPQFARRFPNLWARCRGTELRCSDPGKPRHPWIWYQVSLSTRPQIQD